MATETIVAFAGRPAGIASEPKGVDKSGTVRLLCLDIDGVLNDHRFNDDAKSSTLDPECVSQLNRIIHETGCRILLTSAWRYMILGGQITRQGFEYLLRTHGVTEKVCVVGHTSADGPELGMNRAAQVESWIDGLDGATRVVVVDDLDLGFSDSPLDFVQTDGAIGLTAADADRIIDLLSGDSRG